MLAVYWSFAPKYAFQQFFVVMIVWIHGALGMYSWMVLLPSWKRIGGIVLPVLFAVPVLALLGFAESGRRVLERLENDPAWKTLIIDHLNPIAAMVASMEAGKNQVLWAYGVLVAMALGGMLARVLHARAQPVAVAYDGGQSALGQRRLSLLEISIAADVAHAHVCSGRGRCGTCRVQVEQGAQSLPLLNDLEETALARLHAPAGARLACQARVLGPGVVVTRLLPPIRMHRLHAIQTAGYRHFPWRQPGRARQDGLAGGYQGASRWLGRCHRQRAGRMARLYGQPVTVADERHRRACHHVHADPVADRW